MRCSKCEKQKTGNCNDCGNDVCDLHSFECKDCDKKSCVECFTKTPSGIILCENHKYTEQGHARS